MERGSCSRKYSTDISLTMEANLSVNSSGQHQIPSLYSKSKTSLRRRTTLASISKSKLTSLLKNDQVPDIVSKLEKEGHDVTDEILETKSKQKVIFGLILMLMSGVFYSGLATLVRWAYYLGYSAAEVLVYRASVQMLVAGTTYYIKHKKMQKEYNQYTSAERETKALKDSGKIVLAKKQILAIIGRGIFGAGSTFTYFEGTTLIPVGDCVTLKALAAVFTSIAGWLLLGDKITLKHGLAVLFAMIACVLITQPPMIFGYIESNVSNDFTDDLPGYIVSTASSCFQTGVYICIKLAGKVPVVMLIFSQGTFSCMLGLLVILFWELEFHFFTGDVWEEYVCIFLLCTIGYCAQWTLTRGGQLLIAGLASLMRATDIAWSFLWGIIFFDQLPNYLTIIGAVTMFSSVFMVSLEKIKKAAQKNEAEIDLEKVDKTEYSVHTSDVWSVTVEDVKEGYRDKGKEKDTDTNKAIVVVNRGSFSFGGSINSININKDQLKIQYVPLAEANENFSTSDGESIGDSDENELTPSPVNANTTLQV